MKSPAELIASRSVSERQKLIDEIAPTEEDKRALLYEWRFWARPKQLAPEWEWFIWLLLSGRGFGKTRTGAEWVINRARYGPFFPIALIGQTKADVRDTMVELGESSILKISPPWFMPAYEPSKRRLTWPNGMTATIFSGDEPDQLRGPQHGSAWVDELAKYKYPQETWDNLEFGLRLGDNPQVVVTTTPRPIKIIRELYADEASAIVTGSSYENISNLAGRYVDRVIKKYEGTRLGRQELHGVILTDVPGALWTHDGLDADRVRQAPVLKRIVVAIDPAVSANTDSSNETGMVVAGIDADNHGYLLEDLSGIYTPKEWAEKAIYAYDNWQADAVIGESNQGGDLVASNIRSTAQILQLIGQRTTAEINVKLVRATKGKYTRAEPISSIYEQHRVHHVGMFAELEDQLCTWIPGEDSPDRLDALVWAFTELMLHENDADVADLSQIYKMMQR